MESVFIFMSEGGSTNYPSESNLGNIVGQLGWMISGYKTYESEIHSSYSSIYLMHGVVSRTLGTELATLPNVIPDIIIIMPLPS